MTEKAKASSCLKTGELDGWEVRATYCPQLDPTGSTRLCVLAPEALLQEAHVAQLRQLMAPISVLYRQKIDRRDPKPQGHPGRDYVALNLSVEQVIAALREASTLFYADARAELWIRGGMNEQIILDQDGTIYCYPDDPLFRDAAAATGLELVETAETLENRDYVRHWFRAEADAEEERFIESLGLAEVPVQK